MKRKLPPSEVISSCKNPEGQHAIPIKSNTRPKGIADELNKQKPRPTYDEFRKRRNYPVGRD